MSICSSAGKGNLSKGLTSAQSVVLSDQSDGGFCGETKTTKKDAQRPLLLTIRRGPLPNARYLDACRGVSALQVSNGNAKCRQSADGSGPGVNSMLEVSVWVKVLAVIFKKPCLLFIVMQHYLRVTHTTAL